VRISSSECRREIQTWKNCNDEVSGAGAADFSLGGYTIGRDRRQLDEKRTAERLAWFIPAAPVLDLPSLPNAQAFAGPTGFTPNATHP
jgi:hypothetical protein